MPPLYQPLLLSLVSVDNVRFDLPKLANDLGHDDNIARSNLTAHLGITTGLSPASRAK
jgi:hypothetical protein